MVKKSATKQASSFQSLVIYILVVSLLIVVGSGIYHQNKRDANKSGNSPVIQNNDGEVEFIHP